MNSQFTRTMIVASAVLAAACEAPIASGSGAQQQSLTAVGSLSDLAEVEVLSSPLSAWDATLTGDGRLLVGSQDTAHLWYTTTVNIYTQARIHVFDTTTHALYNTLSLGTGMVYDIVVTPDGTRAYAAISKAGGTTVTVGTNRVAVIDLDTETVVTTIPIGGTNYGPMGMAVTPDGSRVYGTHRGNRTMFAIDVATDTLVDEFHVGGSGGYPVGVAIAVDGTRAYTLNRNTGWIAVVDLVVGSPTYHQVVDYVASGLDVNNGVNHVQVSPDGTSVYLTSYTDDEVAILDTATHGVTHVSVPGGDTWRMDVNPRADLDPSTHDLLVATTDGVVILDMTSPTPSTTSIALTTSPSTFDVAYAGTADAYAYATCLAGTVHVINYEQVCDLDAIMAYIDDLPPTAFSNPAHQSTLISKVGAVATKVDATNHCAAVNQLSNDLLPKTDGNSPPPDWVVDPTGQATLQGMIETCIAVLSELGGCS